MGLKIFDSHTRDIYGRSHPQGTCVLLEVSSLNSLVHYFQSIHNNDIFELKGVKIDKVQNNTLLTTLRSNMTTISQYYLSSYKRTRSNEETNHRQHEHFPWRQ